MAQAYDVPGLREASAPGRTSPNLRTWIFIGVVAANVVAIILLEGFAWVLPDDPSSYTLVDQLFKK